MEPFIEGNDFAGNPSEWSHGKILIFDEDMMKPMLDVYWETESQNTKWGKNRVQSGLLWQAILNEESGEVAKEVLEQDNEKMRAELVQVAAVALNWIKALDRGEVLNWR